MLPISPLRGRSVPPPILPATSRRDRDTHRTHRFAGPQGVPLADVIGDFVIWTKRAVPAYHLAVVVDDHRQGVTHVVRGDDLLDSAARQLVLYRALALRPEPSYIVSFRQARVNCRAAA